MQLIMVKDYTVLTAFGRELKVSCTIRQRTKDMPPAYPESRNGIYGTSAYQPLQFPKGTWNVYTPEPTTHPLMAPFFIPTDAHQIVTCVDGSKFDDNGYGLHHDAQFKDTFGCIRLDSPEDAQWLASEILAALPQGVKIQIL
jgi:hypothetical protein